MTDADVADLSARMARIEQMLAELLRRETMPNADRSLTRQEAARVLGAHPKTLGEITTTDPDPTPGMVTGYRLGRQWRYRMSDLDRYRQRLTAPKTRRAAREREIDWGA